MSNRKPGSSYITKVLNGMALGLFASLIIGLILKQIGKYSGLDFLSHYGQIAQYMMGPAIGAGVAYSRTKSPLGIFSALICGAIGAGTIKDGGIFIGEPVGALVASLIGVEVARLVEDKTKLNIIIVPAATIIAGGLAGSFISPTISSLMGMLGGFINYLTTLHPVPMGILISVVMGIILTLPISSAAISISLGLSGLAAGASIVGCSCHMIGFAVSSFRENKISGLVSQGLGTSMLQISNIIKNPWIALPAVVSSAILGPVATVVFKMEGNKIGGGMGTAGLVGQISTLETMGSSALVKIAILHFILPAILSFTISETMRKKGRIKFGDMKI
ncbi:PTS transporter subunit IIC [Ilyobacter sp.]|uniref:PTS transporter subunit IIC n=2 Tax=Ilyobacter sp. TaxID=3100343 RepID=UPI00356B2EC2